MTKLFAVFGKPILHSKSPMLYNSLFSKTHTDVYYTRIRVDSCEELVRTIRSLNIIGANITTPFKECVIPFLDSLSQEAEQIGAANTITNDNGYLKGYNTDYLGVTKAIEEAGINIFGKRCLVLGAGGASRAAVFGLMNAGAEVFITNRTYCKAVDVSNHLGCNVIQYDEIKELMGSIDIVVSALLPDVSLPDFEWNSEIKLLVDANYRKSKLAEEAQRAGIKVVRGDRWLINQALESFLIFTGFEAPAELINNSMQQSLDYDKVKVKVIQLEQGAFSDGERFDLLIPSEGKSTEDINRIIDEEKRKAING
jgi:shikimate dehydrogenase